jgi:hypothetical protein
MEAMTDALQEVVVTELKAEVQPEPTQPDGATMETQLAQEISTLWSDHVRLSGNRRAASTELRQIRAKLAERLYDIKQLLCRVGRSGQWRSWLKERGIPRSSADRLCERHAETLGIKNENAPAGAIKPKGDSIEELVQSLLPRLRRALPDTQAVFLFIAAVGEAFGLRSYTCDDCTCVYLPGSEWDDPADEESTEDIDSEEAPSPDPVST